MMLAVMAVMMTCLSACAGSPQLVQFNELPKDAQTFVETYFHVADVSYIQREKDGLHYDYEVRMSNGTEIDFNHDGKLESVDCKRQAVPAGIVPEAIVTYIAKQFANAVIVKYEIDRRDQKVELSNSLELEFDLQGNFLRIDD